MSTYEEVKDFFPNTIKYLDHGFVSLIDVMGSDKAIVEAARISFGKDLKTRKTVEDVSLIRYLMRHRHTSPFEMVELKFLLKIPIFVMRQHVRHRTASLNEYSGRYSEMSNEFYFPDESRAFGQSQSNKQQSEGDIAKIDKDVFFDNLEHQYQSSYFCYKSAINSGVSKELARIQLPLANYTELYWKIDLHNFFHYIGLRNDPGHAQTEIVQLARLMYELVKPHVPISCQAFEDYRYNGVTFSVQEQQALAELLKVDDLVMGSMDSALNSYLKGRELNEFKNKLTRIIERK